MQEITKEKIYTMSAIIITFSFWRANSAMEIAKQILVSNLFLSGSPLDNIKHQKIVGSMKRVMNGSSCLLELWQKNEIV